MHTSTSAGSKGSAACVTMSRIVFIVFALLFAMQFASAQGPRMISYQGVLTDSVGAPNPDGDYVFEFSLYDVSTGGSALWTETKILSTKRGLFTTALGDVTPFAPSFNFGVPLWLGVSVSGSAELSPRSALLSVSSSFWSQSADSAGTVSDNSVTSAKIADGSIQFADIHNNGAAPGQVMKWDGVAWTPGYDSGGVGTGGSQWTTLGSTVVFNGNVGIGDTNYPNYRLDVMHYGSTGIRSRSASGFSVVDIDAQNGDAALRFQKAGAGQWNMRNRPGDDNLEIFELGGGGSRVVIQDSTGNVGIGETSNPVYKLDILHLGASGVHVKSDVGSTDYSTVDIDADNGDASLRFQKAGTGKWSMRNRPEDDYLEFFELDGGGSRMVIQDGTGNVGIGETTSPSYKLDVLHGGSTGIRSRSTSSFSVVDIDAQTGDAALRFQKAGVSQWNIRNRPADDYLEIFELGGGGSRVVVQDGTGNVGIGETTAPSYKLDVLHAGATGIRSRSSSTFSLVDIDAANGDAALRFQKAGVGQWNVRNNPTTDDLQIFELGGGGERMRIENTTGNVVVNGNLSKGGGSFKIDHPLDPENKYLYHSFVESPDMMNIYNGNIVTDGSGKAVVELPDYFEALNMEFRYQLTVIGSFAQAIISKKVQNNRFEIATNQPNIEVSWMVTGVRHDAYANMNRIPNAVEKESANRGKYLHPAAFNLPATRGINYEAQADAVNPTNSLTQRIAEAPKPVDASSISGGSLDQPVVRAAETKQIGNSGSVKPTMPVRSISKPVDDNGSVVDTPRDKR